MLNFSSSNCLGECIFMLPNKLNSALNFTFLDYFTRLKTLKGWAWCKGWSSKKPLKCEVQEIKLPLNSSHSNMMWMSWSSRRLFSFGHSMFTRFIANVNKWQGSKDLLLKWHCMSSLQFFECGSIRAFRFLRLFCNLPIFICLAFSNALTMTLLGDPTMFDKDRHN